LVLDHETLVDSLEGIQSAPKIGIIVLHRTKHGELDGRLEITIKSKENPI
jgi:hypothetical protein